MARFMKSIYVEVSDDQVVKGRYIPGTLEDQIDKGLSILNEDSFKVDGINFDWDTSWELIEEERKSS